MVIYDGTLEKIGVRIIITGVENEPDGELYSGCTRVISTGFCGALGENMKPGELVMATQVAFAEKKLLTSVLNPRGALEPFRGAGVFTFELDKKKKETMIRSLEAHGLMVHTGRTVTCSRAITTYREKEKVARYFNAIAVDMEDYYRLCAARRECIGLISVRAVLDELKDEITSNIGGMKKAKISSLLGNIPIAQRSISNALTVLIPLIEAEKK
jgi:nucleoside phosphorylase